MWRYGPVAGSGPDAATSAAATAYATPPPALPPAFLHQQFQLQHRPTPAPTDQPAFKRRRVSTKNCPECTICSGNVFEVCHPHISTRQMLSKVNHFGVAFCPICRQKHAPLEHGGAKKSSRVMLGSSTLHNIWKTRTYSSTVKYHIDFDCIIGGQIHDVHSSFRDQYLEQVPTPLHIMLACGVNNILTEDTPQTIITSYQSFLKSIQEHANIHSVSNKVVICPILYAPKYCDNRLNKVENYLAKVFAVNQWIHQFNRDTTGIEMNLDQQGVMEVPQDPNQGVKHDYSQWREPTWNRMLHMGKEAQESAAAQLIKTFDLLSKLD